MTKKKSKMKEMRNAEVICDLNKVVKEGLSERVTFELKPEGNQGVNYVGMGETSRQKEWLVKGLGLEECRNEYSSSFLLVPRASAFPGYAFGSGIAEL